LDERAHREEPLLVRTYLLTTVLMAQGEKASAKKEAQYLVRSALKETQLYMSGAEAEEMRRAGALAIEVGDISDGRRILDEMERLPSLHESDFTQSCYYNLKGMIEGAAGQTESAIENQRRAALYFADYEPNRALGKEYASRGDWQNAVIALQHYLGYKGEIMRDDSPGDWVLAHLSLARVFAQAGDSTHSLEQYDEFLRLWRNGDQDLLSIREARSERERLQTAIQEGSFSKQGIIRAKQ
jgi:tetratricopeptide (TPR) repeat protein